ncbi:hypothetical protein D9758_002568 [Tetrapyrgos nigripes]|uniref:Uncharacterized protein n=1 Tax=Tetrapyrgos nigripes TaxID=182062 RepID=A0A8H5LU12_9AGAR|nr:hypothetical protein D9758_002568 [Tetrapyrgos nigripes]
MAVRSVHRNMPETHLCSNQQYFASNGQPSSSSSHQSQKDTVDRIDSVLEGIRQACNANSGKKSLRALEKLPERSSVSYARIDYDTPSNTDNKVGTNLLPPMNVDNHNTGLGLYIDRHGTKHALPNSFPVISSTTQPPRKYPYPQHYPKSSAQKRNEVCQRFLCGRCPYGSRCHRIHPTNMSTHPNTPARIDICDVSAYSEVDSTLITRAETTCATYICELDVDAATPTPEVKLPGSSLGSSNIEDTEPKNKRPSVNSKPRSNRITSRDKISRPATVNPGSSAAPENCSIAPPPQPVDGVVSVNLTRSEEPDDASRNTALKEWETGWDCYTDASAWSDGATSASESSMLSTRSRGSTNTSVSGDEPGPSKPRPASVKYPPPACYPAVCRKWLAGLCSRGHTCFFVHRDIEYDLSAVPPKPPTSSSYMFNIRDHIKVRLGPGFDIQEIVTGFESPWLHISQLPSGLQADELSRYLTQRGYPPQDLKMFAHGARVRFSSHIEARNANVSLNGSSHWGVTLSTRLAINNSSGRDISIKDTVVRIQWQAPGVVAYAGYKTLEKANEALEIARREYPNTFVAARLYEGLPAVDRCTVHFSNLPIHTEKEDMDKYAQPSDVMWDEPNYKRVDVAANGIRRLLEYRDFPFLAFDVSPPPYRDGLVQAWAHFSTPSLAKDAAAMLHTRKPKCTGLTRLFARHLQSIDYIVPVDEYRKFSSDVLALRGELWQSASRYTTIGVQEKLNSVVVTLSADDIKELGRLKANFERIRSGEVLRKDREIVWDGFFAGDNGRMYLRGVEKRYSGVIIKEEISRRRIMLFGPLEKRSAVKKLLLDKYEELNAMEQKIPLPTHLVGPFLHSELPSLRMVLGEDTVRVDLWEEEVIVRGTRKAAQTVMQAVQNVGRKQSHRRFGNLASCPVCFGEVDVPVSLKCGHTYCRACLINYFNAATENRFFPLTCLGNDATCGERILLSVPREVLSLGEFDNIVEAAFLAHVHTRPKEFHYCPTPDCLQVYRSAPKGTVIQCPSCLLRICPECHIEYHDGFECLDRDSDQSFKEWVGAHDVKNCPGCKIPIERAEGCNHVTCTQCQSHICWVCMETFPRGEGIYSHMRIEHGGIGLVEDFVFEPFMN